MWPVGPTLNSSTECKGEMYPRRPAHHYITGGSTLRIHPFPPYNIISTHFYQDQSAEVMPYPNPKSPLAWKCHKVGGSTHFLLTFFQTKSSLFPNPLLLCLLSKRRTGFPGSGPFPERKLEFPGKGTRNSAGGFMHQSRETCCKAAEIEVKWTGCV